MKLYYLQMVMLNIEVQINPEQETVWLTQKQMEVLFDVKHARISS